MRMRPHTTMIWVDVLRHFNVSMVQQQERIDLRHPLRRKRLPYRHASHILRMSI
jgi:hypothetical protein